MCKLYLIWLVSIELFSITFECKLSYFLLKQNFFSVLPVFGKLNLCEWLMNVRSILMQQMAGIPFGVKSVGSSDKKKDTIMKSTL